MSNTDIIIIGAGLIGCATAYFLAKQGAHVTVVEKGQLNRGASGRNAGSLHFQLELRHLDHLDQSERDVDAFISYLLEAQFFWSTLNDELGGDIELIQNGGITVAETNEEVERIRQKCKIENKFGLNTRIITGDEAREMAPYLSESVNAAVYSPDEGHANPRIVTLLFAQRAKEYGAKFMTNTLVTNLEQTDSKWEVEINRSETLSAENVVLAGGPWMQKLAAMVGQYVPTYPITQIMSVTEHVKPTINHLIQHVGRRLTIKQVHDGNIIIGGGWPGRFFRDKGALNYYKSPKVIMESLKGNVKVASDVVPGIKNLRLIRSWPGVVGFNFDQLSLLGEFPERKGLFTGGGDSSFTYGPLHGKVLADLIVKGKTDYPIDAFKPKKISHLNLLMP